MSQLVFEALWRDRGVAAGLKSLGTNADASASKVGKLSTAAKVGMLAAGAAILKFGVSSVKAYSDAETSQAKLGFALQKFPKLADTNQASLQKLNAAMQLKTKFDDDAIASGQAVLGQYKLTGKQLEATTPLLLDYAAKTGKDLPAAAAAMGKAFLGNTRALKEIGISYKSTGDQATDFANITQLMRQQIGGFAEAEGKTAAGQLAILKNQFGELQEAAGAKLVPALTAVTGGLIQGVQVIGKYSNVIGPLVVGVGGLATIIWSANKAQAAWAVTQGLTSGLALKSVAGLNALKIGFTGVALTATAAGRAMKIAQLSIPVVGVLLFAATTAMAAWASKGDQGTATTHDFAAAMQSVQGEVTRATAALNENVRAQAVSALQGKGAYDQARLLGISYQDVTDAALGNEDAIGRVNAALSAGKSLNAQQSKSNSDQRNAAMGLADSLGLVAKASIADMEAEKVRRMAMESGATASEAAAAAAKVQADALQAVADKAREAASALLAMSGSQIGMEAAIDAATKSAKDNGKTLDVNTAKGRANRQALDSLAGATLQYTEGLIKSGASADQVVAANERGRQSFIKSARAMGASKKEATELASSLFTIPDNIKAQIVVEGGKISRQEAKDLNKELKDIPAEKRAEIVTIAETKGAKAAKQAIAEVKDKTVIAKSQGDLKGAKAVNSAMKALKDRLILAKSRGDTAGATKLQRAINALKGKTVDGKVQPKGVGGTQKEINSIKGKSVNVNVGASGVGATQKEINSIKGKSVTVSVYRKTRDVKDGGYIDGFAGGGMVRGSGGPRQDNIAGIDRATGVQTSWVSATEFVTNALSTRNNRGVIEEINANPTKKYGLVSLANGGRVGGRDWLTRPMPERVVGMGGGSGPQVYNFHLHAGTIIGSEQEIKRVLENMSRKGMLTGITKTALR